MMEQALDRRKGKFVVRTSTPKSANVSGNMTTLEKIAWMKEHNPRAKLIPFSGTYFKAVAELNMMSKGSLKRPPVPEWFCGHVNTTWPYFEDDEDQTTGDEEMYLISRGKGNGGGNDKYPWDRCCELGLEPNTPGYMWCDEDVDLVAVNGDTSFLADFTIDDIYAEATWPEGPMSEEECVVVNTMPTKSGEWSVGGWGTGNIGAAGVTISSATISGRSKISWSYTSGKSIVDGWTADHALACLWLKAEGKVYSGKFEWVKPGQTSKDLKNVKCGYGGWTAGALSKATEAKFCVCHDEKKICSNWANASI